MWTKVGVVGKDMFKTRERMCQEEDSIGECGGL